MKLRNLKVAISIAKFIIIIRSLIFPLVIKGEYGFPNIYVRKMKNIYRKFFNMERAVKKAYEVIKRGKWKICDREKVSF